MTNNAENPWPTHKDGRPKKMNEMSPGERKTQFKEAAQRVKATMETLPMRQAIQEFVDGTSDAQTKH